MRGNKPKTGKTSPGSRIFQQTRIYLTSLCKIPWIWCVQEGLDILPGFRHSDIGQCMFCGHAWQARNHKHKAGNRCSRPGCAKDQTDRVFHKGECNRCGHVWEARETSGACPRCKLPLWPKRKNKQTEPIMYGLLRLYRDELDLIWERLGLRESQFLIIREYLCIGCYSGAGRKCKRSRQRIEQVVKKGYALLSRPRALRELKLAMKLFGKHTGELDGYIECSVAMHSVGRY